MRGDIRIHQLGSNLLKLRERPHIIALPAPGVCNHVSDDDRGKPSDQEPLFYAGLRGFGIMGATPHNSGAHGPSSSRCATNSFALAQARCDLALLLLHLPHGTGIALVAQSAVALHARRIIAPKQTLGTA